MDLLDEESHRLLLWTVRLAEVGGNPSHKQLRRLAEPRRPAALSVVSGLSGRDAHFSEGAIASLLRRGLIDELDGERVAPTELGRLVVSALDLHPQETPLFEVLEADLDSSDPLTLARIAGRIASFDRPTVVDPYCRRPQLEYLVTHTSVDKLLVSDRVSDDELDDMVEFVRSIRHRSTRLRIRVAPAAMVHDRHIIDGDRILQVGALADGLGGGTTVLAEPIDLDGDIRRYYRQVWKRAEKLATYRPGEDLNDRAA